MAQRIGLWVSRIGVSHTLGPLPAAASRLPQPVAWVAWREGRFGVGGGAQRSACNRRGWSLRGGRGGVVHECFGLDLVSHRPPAVDGACGVCRVCDRLRWQAAGDSAGRLPSLWPPHGGLDVCALGRFGAVTDGGGVGCARLNLQQTMRARARMLVPGGGGAGWGGEAACVGQPSTGWSQAWPSQAWSGRERGPRAAAAAARRRRTPPLAAVGAPPRGVPRRLGRGTTAVRVAKERSRVGPRATKSWRGRRSGRG